MISFPSTDFAYFVGPLFNENPIERMMFSMRPDVPVFCVQYLVHSVESCVIPNPVFCVQTDIEKGVSCRPEKAAWILTDETAIDENTFGYESVLIVKSDELKKEFNTADVSATELAMKVMLDIGIRKICPYGVDESFMEKYAGSVEFCDWNGNVMNHPVIEPNPCETAIDYIIPLGNGSKSKNDELRILLRSLEKNAYNLGRIVIVSQCAPEWLRNVIIVQMDDELPHNKDGNIINKVLAGIKTVGIAGEFVWSADDLALVRPVDLSTLPPIYNRNGMAHFVEEAKKPKRRWHERMVRTFDFAKSLGLNLECNYEAHAIQRINASELLGAIRKVDYESGIGYGIMTLFAMLTDRMGGEPQERWKTCHETEESAKSRFGSVPFVQYNDRAFLNGLRERLFDVFPMKSRYEF